MAKIHLAATEGDLGRLEACLRAGEAVNARNKRQNTPLMLGAVHGHLAAVSSLLEAGADPTMTNNSRLTARELAARGCGGRRQDDAQIAALLVEAEHGQQRQPPPQQQQQQQQQQQLLCPVCGQSIPRRQKIDYLVDNGTSRYVTEFLASDALHTMRTHPQHHYHSILNMRSLQKEVSESWALVVCVREIFKELGVDPSQVVVFDLCSGKGLTAACLALEFPMTQVIALDVISGRHLPHTSDLHNLRYMQADLFTSAEALEKEMGCGPGSHGTGSVGTAKLPLRRLGILVGSHLCGRLSTQAVKLFHSLDGTQNCGVFRVSPCNALVCY
jgi:hypothetical protein